MTDHEHWWMGEAPEFHWYHLLYLLLGGLALLALELGIMWLMGEL